MFVFHATQRAISEHPTDAFAYVVLALAVFMIGLLVWVAVDCLKNKK